MSPQLRPCTPCRRTDPAGCALSLCTRLRQIAERGACVRLQGFSAMLAQAHQNAQEVWQRLASLEGLAEQQFHSRDSWVASSQGLCLPMTSWILDCSRQLEAQQSILFDGRDVSRAACQQVAADLAQLLLRVRDAEGTAAAWVAWADQPAADTDIPLDSAQLAKVCTRSRAWQPCSGVQCIDQDLYACCVPCSGGCQSKVASLRAVRVPGVLLPGVLSCLWCAGQGPSAAGGQGGPAAEGQAAAA